MKVERLELGPACMKFLMKVVLQVLTEIYSSFREVQGQEDPQVIVARRAFKEILYVFFKCMIIF